MCAESFVLRPTCCVGQRAFPGMSIITRPTCDDGSTANKFPYASIVNSSEQSHWLTQQLKTRFNGSNCQGY